MEKVQKLQNLKSQKLYIRVYDEIRNYIYKNNLKAGDKLPTEMEMCEMLGVSRNVLREAIKSLEITGIVSSKPGVGIIIRDFNVDYIMSTFINSFADGDLPVEQYIEELRRVLELGFVDKAFESLTEEDIQALGSLVEQMKLKAKKQEESGKDRFQLGAAFAQADAAFHKTLFSHIENKFMVSIISFFWAYDKYYKEKTTHEYLALTVEKHQRIYDALKAHDYKAFTDAMQFHFNYGYFKK